MKFNFTALLRHAFNVPKHHDPAPVDVPPTAHTLCVQAEDGGQPVSGAHVAVWWDGLARPFVQTTDAFGRAFFPNIPDTANPAVRLEHDGYEASQAGVGAVGVYIAPLTRSFALAGEAQAVHQDGLVFRRADGSLFPWRGVSDFALFHRFCLGEDIHPIVDERIRLGANVFTTFSMYDPFGIGGVVTADSQHPNGLGMLSPATVPDYYAKVRAYTAFINSREAFVEWVYFADADQRSDGTGGVMPDRAAQDAHAAAMDAALAGLRVFKRNGNEPFKNIVGVDRFTLDPSTGPTDIGLEVLNRGQGTLAHRQFVGVHDHDRGEEWPRHARSLGEIRDGFGWDLKDDERAAHPEWAEGFEGAHVPCPWTEPMGASELDQPGRRFTSVTDAGQAAATAALEGAGSTFHSDDGVASRLFRPTQKACAIAWFTAAKFIPPECQLAPYQRGGRGGGKGIGDMPIEHHDLDEGVQPAALRSFAKELNPTLAYAVRIRGVGGTVTRNGWRVDTEIAPGVLKLTR